jgi:hypothetical protein
MRKRTPLAFVIAVLSIAATARAGDNWPQWRGPSLNGVHYFSMQEVTFKA